MAFAGWVNRFQQDAIEYLKEENRVLREQLGGSRLRFTDVQRRRLAAKARTLCRTADVTIAIRDAEENRSQIQTNGAEEIKCHTGLARACERKRIYRHAAIDWYAVCRIPTNLSLIRTPIERPK